MCESDRCRSPGPPSKPTQRAASKSSSATANLALSLAEVSPLPFPNRELDHAGLTPFDSATNSAYVREGSSPSTFTGRRSVPRS